MNSGSEPVEDSRTARKIVIRARGSCSENEHDHDESEAVERSYLMRLPG
jgi:hypothetical protein